MFLSELLQAASTAQPDLNRRAADVVQYFIAIGVVALIGLVLKQGQRITAIETSLNDLELGVKPALTSLRKSRHNDANTLQAHETRLDGHDRDIERLDAVFERRAPNQPEQPFGGRRATT
jgi:hypothetical protein